MDYLQQLSSLEIKECSLYEILFNQATVTKKKMKQIYFKIYSISKPSQLRTNLLQDILHYQSC